MNDLNNELKLFRRYPDESPISAGICAGIAYHVGWPLWLVRLICVLLVWSGVSALVYVLFWFFVPPAETPDDFATVTGG